MIFPSVKEVVSIDMGTSSIKIAVLGIHKKEIVLKKVGVLEMGILEVDADKQQDRNPIETTIGISKLLDQLGIKPKKVKALITALRGDQVRLKQVKSIPLSRDELQTAMAFEARKHMPVEGEALMDCQILNRDDKEMDVLLAVTSKEAIENHVEILRNCSLLAQTIDAPPLGVANAHLLHPKHTTITGTRLYLHVGASNSTICIHRKNGLFFAREIPYAGFSFTQDIAQQLDVDLPQAEALKRKNGIFQKNGDSDLAQNRSKIELLSNVESQNNSVDQLVREIIRSIRFYSKETGDATIDKYYVSGGSCQDSHFNLNLESKLGQPLQRLNPLEDLPTECEIPSNGSLQFTQVLGMAFRGIRELFPDQSK